MGDIDASGEIYDETDNVLCYFGDLEGMANCSIPLVGRYITIVSQSSERLEFAEVYAFENNDLTTLCKPPTLTDISVSSGK